MHGKQICHRDIKLDNLIYSEQTKVLKIIDFGFACCCKEKLKTYCGTPSYMCPEIVQKREYRGDEADMWAVGVVMYTVLTGYLPFKGKDEKELERKIVRGQYAPPQNTKNKIVSPEARALLK